MNTELETQMEFALSVESIKAVGKVCVPFAGPMRLEADEYWIGDLSYVLSDNDWSRACEHFGNRRAVRLISGEVAIIFGTYGDGYHANTSGKGVIPVDSGTIGIVPATAVEAKADHGFSKTFSQPFICEMDDKRIVFGDVSITL